MTLAFVCVACEESLDTNVDVNTRESSVFFESPLSYTEIGNITRPRPIVFYLCSVPVQPTNFQLDTVPAQCSACLNI